jgi:hypothetical protein
MKTNNRKRNMLLAACAVVIAGMLGSCSKSSSSSGGPTPPTNPGGYDSAGQVASANLVAYWSFNGTLTDAKQGLAGSNNGSTFTTGLKGQGYQGGGNSYVTYSNTGNLGSLSSFTISVWINQPSQPVNNTTSGYIAGQGAQGILFLYDTAGNWNLLHMDLEPYTPVSGDSVRIHAGFNNTGNTAGAGWTGIVPEGFLDTAIAKWTHVVLTYDGTSSNYTLYHNGQPIAVNSAWANALTPQTMYNGPSGDPTTTPMGGLHFKYAPQGLILGAFPQVATPNANIGGPQPWSGNLQGAMDELRVYNKALNAQDVASLYILEKAGF